MGGGKRRGGGGQGGGLLSIIPISHSSSAPEVLFFEIKDIGGLLSSLCTRAHNKLNGISFEQSKRLFSPSSLFRSYQRDGAALSPKRFMSTVSAHG